MTDAELIRALGGATKLATALGVGRGRVAMWLSRCAVPAEHHLTLWDMALAEGLDWTPPNAEGLRDRLRGAAPVKADAA